MKTEMDMEMETQMEIGDEDGDGRQKCILGATEAREAYPVGRPKHHDNPGGTGTGKPPAMLPAEPTLLRIPRAQRQTSAAV